MPQMTQEQLLAMPAESYMEAEQKAFFRELLLARQAEARENIAESRKQLSTLEVPPDLADLSSVEEERRRLVAEIVLDGGRQLREQGDAIKRIDDDEYGWCDLTGEEIGLKRLLAVPETSYCHASQEVMELRLRTMRHAA